MSGQAVIIRCRALEGRPYAVVRQNHWGVEKYTLDGGRSWHKSAGEARRAASAEQFEAAARGEPEWPHRAIVSPKAAALRTGTGR